jgi:Fur family ferric uptake transcriptional regulator
MLPLIGLYVASCSPGRPAIKDSLVSKGGPLIACNGTYNQAKRRSLRTAPQKRVDDAPRTRDNRLSEAERILGGYLREKGLKQSTKRDRVLEVFLATRDHLSTEDLHLLVKEKDPTIGYTTVYRTLKLLTQCGLAFEVDFQDGVVRYEHGLNRRTHHHMVCTSCGDSVEFFAPELEEVQRRIGDQFRFKPLRHTFQILGTCQACLKKKRPPAIRK